MSKKDDEFLQDIFEEYKKSVYYKKHEAFKEAYEDVKTKYCNIIKKIYIKNPEEFIKYERYRIENAKFGIESNTNPISYAIIVLIVSIAVPLLIEIYKLIFGDKATILLPLFGEVKWTVLLIIIILLIFIIAIGYIFKDVIKYTNKVRIYDLAIKVLNDIEKEYIKEIEINKLQERVSIHEKNYMKLETITDILYKQVESIKNRNDLK